jgi:hypothetical protein
VGSYCPQIITIDLHNESSNLFIQKKAAWHFNATSLFNKYLEK